MLAALVFTGLTPHVPQDTQNLLSSASVVEYIQDDKGIEFAVWT
jgi:hypothetical protein